MINCWLDLDDSMTTFQMFGILETDWGVHPIAATAHQPQRFRFFCSFIDSQLDPEPAAGTQIAT